MDLDRLIGAGNIVLSVTSFVVAGFFFWRLYRGDIEGYAALLAGGITLSALGVGMHRAWWGLARVMESSHPGFLELVRSLSGITVLFVAIAISGYALHLSPVLQQWFGPFWGLYYAAACALLFCLVLFL